MMKRHVLGAAVTAVSAFLAVGFVTAQPDAAQAVAGERVSVFRLEREPGTGDDVLMVTNESGPVRAFHVTEKVAHGGSGDQYFTIDAANGEERISFTFTDAPLPVVLMPLAGFVSHGTPGPGSMDVAIVRALDEDAETIYGMTPDEVVAAIEQATHVVPPGAVSGTGGGPQTFARFVGVPRSDNLVLEYPEAANRTVSITAVNLTVDEAIDLIAQESGCNIFQDGETIIVDYCDQ